MHDNSPRYTVTQAIVRAIVCLNFGDNEGATQILLAALTDSPLPTRKEISTNGNAAAAN